MSEAYDDETEPNPTNSFDPPTNLLSQSISGKSLLLYLTTRSSKNYNMDMIKNKEMAAIETLDVNKRNISR